MQSTFNIKSTLVVATCLVFVFVGSISAQETVEKQTVEPVFRVPKLKRDQQAPNNAPVQSSQPEYRTARSVIERPINNTPNVVQSPSQTQQPVQQQPLQAVAPPVARVADAGEMAAPDKKLDSIIPNNIATQPLESHPLDRAIEIARNGLDGIRQNVADYTAILVKRERVDGRLCEPNYMRIKIRNPRVINNQEIPFSIYMKFLKPRASAGREVIWVDGQNSNNLIAHETGMLRFKNFHLDPDGFLAMKGNKYPIYDAGLENLVIKLIEKAERDKTAGVCEVRYSEDAQINKRPCSLIEVKHNEKRHPYEFHIAKVYIDQQLQLPVRYVSYDWPVAGGRPKIIEEYTYINIKTNVGLTDDDFKIANPAYNFARN